MNSTFITLQNSMKLTFACFVLLKCCLYSLYYWRCGGASTEYFQSAVGGPFTLLYKPLFCHTLVNSLLKPEHAEAWFRPRSQVVISCVPRAGPCVIGTGMHRWSLCWQSHRYVLGQVVAWTQSLSQCVIHVGAGASCCFLCFLSLHCLSAAFVSNVLYVFMMK